MHFIITMYAKAYAIFTCICEVCMHICTSAVRSSTLDTLEPEKQGRGKIQYFSENQNLLVRLQKKIVAWNSLFLTFVRVTKLKLASGKLAEIPPTICFSLFRHLVDTTWPRNNVCPSEKYYSLENIYIYIHTYRWAPDFQNDIGKSSFLKEDVFLITKTV